MVILSCSSALNDNTMLLLDVFISFMLDLYLHMIRKVSLRQNSVLLCVTKINVINYIIYYYILYIIYHISYIIILSIIIAGL